jgi:hypothetical protein
MPPASANRRLSQRFPANFILTASQLLSLPLDGAVEMREILHDGQEDIFEYEEVRWSMY